MKKLLRIAAVALGLVSADRVLAADPLGVTVNGVDVSAGSGDGWSYVEQTTGARQYVVFSKTMTYVVSGTNTQGKVRFDIKDGASGISPHIVLSDLVIGGYGENHVAGVYVGSRDSATIELRGVNEIAGGTMRPAIEVQDSASLAITGDGALYATAGAGADCVGRYGGCSAGTIRYSGGTFSFPVSNNQAAAGFCVRTVSKTIGGRTFVSEVVPFRERGLKVNGVDIGYLSGDGWRLEDAPANSEAAGTEYLQLVGASRYELTGSVTGVRVAVQSDKSTVVVSNVTLFADCSTRKTVWDGLISFRNISEATLELKGTNVLSGTGSYFGAGVYVNPGVHLTIREADGCAGTLRAKAGVYGAGIGGYCSGSGPITIASGTVFATGGNQGAGIGAGDGWNRTTTYGLITIAGGRVTATCGTYSAAIGPGNDCEGGSVRICGGTVLADGSWTRKAIGPGRSYGAYETTVEGGSVKALGDILPTPTRGSSYLRRVTVACVAQGPVTVTGLPDYYGVNDLYPQDGKLFFYLPNGDYAFEVNGVAYTAKVDSDTEAKIVPVSETLTIPASLPAHVSGVKVETNGVDITATGSAGQYRLCRGCALTVTFTAESGWHFPSGGTVRTFTSNPFLAPLTITEADIGIPVEDDRYVTVTVTVAVTARPVSFSGLLVNDVSVAKPSPIERTGATEYAYRVREGSKVTAVFATSGGWRFVGNGLQEMRTEHPNVRSDLALSNLDAAYDVALRTLRLTLPHPLPEHVTNVTVTADGKVLSGTNGVYGVAYGSAVQVVFDAEAGYEFEGGGTRYTLDRPSLTDDATVAETDLPARRPVYVEPDVAAVVSVGGATNFYHSVTTACARIVSGDTLYLLTNCTERLDLDRGFAVTLDGLGWTVRATNALALTAFGSTVTVRDTVFDGTRSQEPFAYVEEGASLALTNVTAGGYALTNAPLVYAAGGLQVTDCAFSNNAATVLFRLANASNGVAAAQLLTATVTNNACDGHVHVVRGGATLGTAFWTRIVRLGVEEPKAFVAPFGSAPAGDVYLSFDEPDGHVGRTIVTNAWGTALAAANVRICAAGYAAFGTDGNLTVETTWSRPFATVAGGQVVGTYRTAAEALAATAGDVDLRLLDYRNDVLGFRTNVVTEAVDVPSGRTVTLDSVLRRSTDGTNTTWTVDSSDFVTLASPLCVSGTAVVNRVTLAGGVTIRAGGVLRLGKGFSFGGQNLYVTLADDPKTMGEGVFVVADGLTSAELKARCRVTNVGWTFEPVAGGLRVKEVSDIVARVGLTEYVTFSNALAAAGNGETVTCVTLTNATTGAHVDAVVASRQTLSVASGSGVTVGSERRLTVGSDVTWDGNAVTTLELDQTTLDLGAGGELRLAGVNVTGTLKLTGDGILVVTNYAGGPISVAFDVPAAAHSVSRRFALGSRDRFALVGEGELVERDGFVYWQHSTFSWSYLQTENGVVYLDVNDGGTEVRDIKVTSQTGKFSYTYMSDRTGAHTLVGYLLYVDYGNRDGDKPRPVVRLPEKDEVTCEYLDKNGEWRGVRNGDDLMLDWQVDGDGRVTFAFTPVATGVRDERKIAGFATPKNLTPEEHQACVNKVLEPKQDDGDVGAMLTDIFQGATVVAIGAGVFAGMQALVPGGALAGGGIGGLAALRQTISTAMRIKELLDKYKRFHDAISDVVDFYTYLQMAKDIIQMLSCPLEYKGIPYFASNFQHVHQMAGGHNDPQFGVHWFFSSDISAARIVEEGTYGNVDLSAKFSVEDFIKNEAAIGSLKQGSALERFMDAMNWFMRFDAILATIIERQPQKVAILGETVGLIRQILNAARARGYFDPPVDSSVVIPYGCGYSVEGMNFGIKSMSAKQNRTAPVLDVSGKLRLSDCKFGGYSYNCTKGLVHVCAGGELTLANVTVETDCTSADGTPEIVADPGAVVWLCGNTTLPSIGAGADLRVGQGSYRGSSSAPSAFTGSVAVRGRTLVGKPIGRFAFMDETTNGYSRIRSASYDGLVRPLVTGDGARWALRDGVAPKLAPGFNPPYSIQVVTVGSSRYARLTGGITNAVGICTYHLTATENLTNAFTDVSSGRLDLGADGRFSKDIPIESASRFFKVDVRLADE